MFRAQAQAVTLTVAQAFKVALDLWEMAQEGELLVTKGLCRPLQSVAFPSRCDVKADFSRNGPRRLALAATRLVLLWVESFNH